MRAQCAPAATNARGDFLVIAVAAFGSQCARTQQRLRRTAPRDGRKTAVAKTVEQQAHLAATRSSAFALSKRGAGQTGIIGQKPPRSICMVGSGSAVWLDTLGEALPRGFDRNGSAPSPVSEPLHPFFKPKRIQISATHSLRIAAANATTHTEHHHKQPARRDPSQFQIGPL